MINRTRPARLVSLAALYPLNRYGTSIVYNLQGPVKAIYLLGQTIAAETAKADIFTESFAEDEKYYRLLRTVKGKLQSVTFRIVQ